MSKVLQHNYIKNFFKLKQYLLKHQFNSKIIDYAEDNGHYINYICFTFAIDNAGIHYVLATNTIKNNGYRIIVIKHSIDNIKSIRYVENPHNKKFTENIKSKNTLEIYYSGTLIYISIAYQKVKKFVEHIPYLNFIDINKVQSDLDKHTVSITSYGREIKMYPEDIEELHQISEQTFLSIMPIMEVLQNLKTIIFDNYFNEAIPQHILPNNIEYIRFGNNYDKHIDLNTLPSSLKILSFGNTFNWPIGKRVLPNLLKKLIFGNSFNQPIVRGILPKYLKTLVFGDNFNWNISSALPPVLKRLSFGDRYNRKFKSELPKTLRYLHLGIDYNKVINDEYIPESLVIYRN